jgi:hypothetical protein
MLKLEVPTFYSQLELHYDCGFQAYSRGAKNGRAEMQRNFSMERIRIERSPSQISWGVFNLCHYSAFGFEHLGSISMDSSRRR